jgi:hypothetical protein
MDYFLSTEINADFLQATHGVTSIGTQITIHV